MKSLKPIQISNLNIGGLSDSKYLGRPGSVAKMVGLNIHGKPGVFSANQRLSSIIGEVTVDALARVSIATSTGNVYFFAGENNGKVWRYTSEGVFELVFEILGTEDGFTGDEWYLGALEYGGYLYFATSDWLHRIDLSLEADWDTNVELNWAELENHDPDYHPMMIQNKILFIGDGNYIHQVEEGVFSAQALDLPLPYRVKTLEKADVDLLIGTTVDDLVTKTLNLRWNTYSPSWTSDDSIEEPGVNAYIPVENNIFVQAGKSGRIYFYNGEDLDFALNIPGEYGVDRIAEVNPNCVGSLMGMPIFAVSNGVGNPVLQGVYSLETRNPTLFPRVLNLEYVISDIIPEEGEVPEHVELRTEDIEFGSIEVKGTDMFVAYKRTEIVDEAPVETIDIHKIDFTTKQDKAYMETMYLYSSRDELSTIRKIVVNYVSLPENTDIEIWYRLNYSEGEWVQATTKPDEIRQLIEAELGEQSFAFELRVVLRTNENDSPVIDIVQIYTD